MSNIKYLDSNVFIRLIIGDHEQHLQKSKKVFSSIEGGDVKAMVSLLVVNEVIWILEHYYGLKRKIYVPELMKLFALKNLKVVEVKKSVIIKILREMQKDKYDFTDHYLAEIATKNTLFSFDRDFEKLLR